MENENDKEIQTEIEETKPKPNKNKKLQKKINRILQQTKSSKHQPTIVIFNIEIDPISIIIIGYFLLKLVDFVFKNFTLLFFAFLTFGLNICNNTPEDEIEYYVFEFDETEE
jgi:F0F1-type ATP synthase assembly protein I